MKPLQIQQSLSDAEVADWLETLRGSFVIQGDTRRRIQRAFGEPVQTGEMTVYDKTTCRRVAGMIRRHIAEKTAARLSQ